MYSLFYKHDQLYTRSIFCKTDFVKLRSKTVKIK